MFRVHSEEAGKVYRYAVIGLLLLSAAALAVTVWVMLDFLREQEIVDELIRKLPNDAKGSAEELAGELLWQFRLTILVVLNVVVTGIAIALLWRAYRSSQQSLRDLKALASDILSSMDQAVITTDLDGNVTSINRRGLELLTPERECVGRSLAYLSANVPLDEFRNEWLVNQSVAMTRDFPTTSNGSDRILRGFCQSLTNGDGDDSGFVIQLRDVTERVLIDDRMRRMERYMGLGSLAAGLHHEIKNPLAALSLHVQLLEEELENSDDPDEVHRMLDVIKTEMTRVGGVLEGFRDFASIGKLNLCPVNPRELIQRQVDLIAPQARAAAVEIQVQIADDLPSEFAADPIRLEQVLLNLLVNALQAMPDGGQVTVSATAASDTIVLTVSDTGPGIPDDVQDKVFDPYFTTKNDGTGLGLALCDRIISQHNGRLTLRSSSHGTTFQINLPIAPRTPATSDE